MSPAGSSAAPEQVQLVPHGPGEAVDRLGIAGRDPDPVRAQPREGVTTTYREATLPQPLPQPRGGGVPGQDERGGWVGNRVEPGCAQDRCEVAGVAGDLLGDARP